MESLPPFRWEGITRDKSYDSGGAIYAQNSRFYLEGECQRRRGLTLQVAQSGTVLQNYLHPQSGYWAIFTTSTGTIEASAL
jgi:predicted outer membrane repeat protein